MTRKFCFSTQWKHLNARFVAVSLLIAVFGFVTPAYAIDAVSPQNLKLKGIVRTSPVQCLVSFDNAGADSVSFGQVIPYQIKAAPTDTTLNTLIATSNFHGVYDTREPMAILKISCNQISPPNPTSFQVQYGKLAQKVAMANSTISAFKLDGTLNQDVLAFGMYVQDRHALSVGRQGAYVTPGDSRLLIPWSFAEESGRYNAYMEIFPGLYWIDSANTTSSAGTATSSIDFVVTIN